MSKLAALLGSNIVPIVGIGVVAAGTIGVGAYLGIFSRDDLPVVSPQDVAQPLVKAPDAEIVGAEPKPESVADPEPVAEPKPESVAEPEPVAEPEGVVEVEPEPVVEVDGEEDAAALIGPSIDEVRSEPDGLTVIAGRAEPKSDIILFVNSVENIAVKAGTDGTFAIVAFLEPSTSAQVLSVVQRVGDIELVAADIILAPQPVAVAQANDEPAAAPVTDPKPEPVSEPVADPTEQEIVEVEPTEHEIAETATTAEVEAKPEQPASTSTSEVASISESLAADPEVDNAVEPSAKPDETVVAQAPVEESEIQLEPESEKAPEPAPKPAAPQKEPEPEQTEVAILKSDEEGVEIINRSAAPEVMSNVEIDTISYSEEGDVLLSGRAQAEATSVRVYLDNAAITTLVVDGSGRWRGDLPDVDTGVYTLRIDEVDEEGAVTSRVETPFKRESPEVLAQAGGSDGAPAKAITVQTGATLWAIARDRYGDGTLFVRVFEANSDTIKDPNLIYPGQVFDLPE